MIRRCRSWRTRAVVAVVGATAIGAHPASAAEQHLVSPGDSIEFLQRKLQPGDEIILLPGRHRPFRLAGLRGDDEGPFRIRSLENGPPAIITGGAIGIELTDVRDVEIDHLVIEDMEIAGVLIVNEPGADSGPPRPEAPDIVISDVAIHKIGPTGNRDAIRLEGADHVAIRRCRVSGWGGSAIDLQACRHVVIEQCLFEGRLGFTQANGVEMRGGTAHVLIDACDFRATGAHAVVFGGRTPPEAYRELPPDELDDPRGPRLRYEAHAGRIEESRIEDVACPIALMHARRCEVKQCTVINPGRWFAAAIRVHADERYGDVLAPLFGFNAVVWNEANTPERRFHLGRGVDGASFQLEPNLWWGPTPTSEADEIPGEMPSTQQTDIDPALNAAGRATNPEAELYGCTVRVGPRR